MTVRFMVSSKVFEKMENVCFGVVVARGINNQAHEEIARLLERSIASVEEKFKEIKVKEATEIMPYREAFTKLGMNPNKFMSSIEAMVSRIEKGKGFPNINSVVDLGNAVSLTYFIPLGAHDLDSTPGDICVRFSNQGDRFTPFGQAEEELLDEGELVYSVGDMVKTRRWIWRQSEYGKVTEESRNVFFPLDGFTGVNSDSVIQARDELAKLLHTYFGCSVKTGFVDKDNRVIELDV